MLVGIGNILTILENITHRKRFICYHVGIFKKPKVGKNKMKKKEGRNGKNGYLRTE